MICKRVQELLLKEQPVQLSPEWFLARKGKVTASAVSSLLIRDEKTCKGYVETYNLKDTFDYNGKSCNPYSSKQQFAFEKCRQMFKGSPATFWGQRYEQIAVDIYSLQNSVKVIDFGLLAHDTIDWLAASPDGITEDGIMLEIKCPYRRKITGIPPLYYFQQVQIQLETTGLEYCDFLEVEFVEVVSLKEFLDDTLNDSPVEYKGFYIQMECIPDEFETRNYYYAQKELINKPKELNKWSRETIEKILEDKNLDVLKETENYVICMADNYKKYTIRVVYWKATTVSTVRIKRDREWFENNKDFLKAQWDDVMDFKANFNPADIKEEVVGDCMF